MTEQTIEGLQVEYDKLEAEATAAAAKKQTLGESLNRLRGAASLAIAFRGVGISETGISGMVALAMEATAKEVADATEANRLAMIAEAETQEAQNRKERAEWGPGKPWAGDPSVDGLPPAPPSSTLGSVAMDTVKLGVQPGEKG